MAADTRVWVYQANRLLSDAEVAEIDTMLQQFTLGWKAHGRQLEAMARIEKNAFIIIAVNQQAATASGCSIDASVRLIQEIGEKYKVDFFDRYSLAYEDSGTLYITGKEEFETLVKAGIITSATIVYNNMVQSAEEFEQKWRVPFNQSWHARVFADLLPAEA